LMKDGRHFRKTKISTKNSNKICKQSLQRPKMRSAKNIRRLKTYLKKSIICERKKAK